MGLVFVLLAIVILAGSINRLELHPGEKTVFTGQEEISPAAPGKTVQENRSLVNLPSWIVWLLFLPFVYVFLRALRRPKLAPMTGRYWIRYLFVFAVAMALVAAVSAALIYSSGEPGIISPASGFRAPVLIFDPAFQHGLPNWLILPLILLLCGGMVIALKRAVWSRGDAQRAVHTVEQLVQEVEQAAANISSGSAAKEAILGCYRNMCTVLNSCQGVERRESMTAQEFAADLSRQGFESNHIQLLTQLFEKARYGFSNFSERESERAVSCLHEISNLYARQDAH